jgi:hypothetical protein
MEITRIVINNSPLQQPLTAFNQDTMRANRVHTTALLLLTHVAHSQAGKQGVSELWLS